MKTLQMIHYFNFVIATAAGICSIFILSDRLSAPGAFYENTVKIKPVRYQFHPLRCCYFCIKK